MASVHLLKVTIAGIKPPVWRRVVVPSRVTLADLHEVVQAAFGWWGYHLREFEISAVRYGSDDGEDWDPPEDERRARLDKLALAGSAFSYTYDFGDNWRGTTTWPMTEGQAQRQRPTAWSASTKTDDGLGVVVQWPRDMTGEEVERVGP